MARWFASSVTTLAFLAGFVAAPHTHFHPSRHDAASDSHHAQAVLHSHVASHERDHEHEHDAPTGADPHDGDGLSVPSFVFQPVKNHALADAAAVLPRAVAPRAWVSGWTTQRRQKPAVYGSPPILTSASRAPPTLLLRAV